MTMNLNKVMERGLPSPTSEAWHVSDGTGIAISVLMTFAANAEPLKHCDGVLSLEILSSYTPAGPKTCFCTTYSGSVCSGQCTASGRPFGCLCKWRPLRQGLSGGQRVNLWER
jgi:hypothetical protein